MRVLGSTAEAVSPCHGTTYTHATSQISITFDGTDLLSNLIYNSSFFYKLISQKTTQSLQVHD